LTAIRSLLQERHFLSWDQFALTRSGKTKGPAIATIASDHACLSLID
jgi:hypothetical protein